MAQNPAATNPPPVQPPVPGAQGGQATQVPLRILLSPWDGDIDLSTKTGKSLWDEGTRPFENKFSGSGKDLVQFIADVNNRVKKCR